MSHTLLIKSIKSSDSRLKSGLLVSRTTWCDRASEFQHIVEFGGILTAKINRDRARFALINYVPCWVT